MTAESQKAAAAKAAVALVEPAFPRGAILGVGTGSTAAAFVDALGPLAEKIGGAVASSEATRARLVARGVRVVDLNDVDAIPFYVDGADEIDAALAMVKGGGGALTREKIVAAVATTFVCICDASKKVERLGARPVPVEVVPMARAQVARALRELGGEPVLRAGFVTDNGNVILDTKLVIDDAIALEETIEAITGVVACGLFALRGADVLLLADDDGVRVLRAP